MDDTYETLIGRKKGDKRVPTRAQIWSRQSDRKSTLDLAKRTCWTHGKSLPFVNKPKLYYTTLNSLQMYVKIFFFRGIFANNFQNHTTICKSTQVFNLCLLANPFDQGLKTTVCANQHKYNDDLDTTSTELLTEFQSSVHCTLDVTLKTTTKVTEHGWTSR